MRPLRKFTTASVAKIREAIPRNIKTYLGQEDGWDFDPNAQEVILESGIYLEAVELSPSRKEDAANAIKIYQALNGMKPIHAADGRIWTWLAHIPWKQYATGRWSETLSRGETTEKITLRIEDRFFQLNNTIGSLMGNSLSRLWWAAHMTRTQGEKPWRLTEILFKNQSMAQALTERAYGRNREILHGILNWIGNNWDLIESAPGGADKAAKRIAKYINLQGAVSILDTVVNDLPEIVRRSVELEH